jgi:hypothetical protein
MVSGFFDNIDVARACSIGVGIMKSRGPPGTGTSLTMAAVSSSKFLTALRLPEHQ